MLIVKKIKNRGKRLMTYVRGENVDRKAKPYKPLTTILKKNSGRMRSGKISIRHRGGGSRRRYRIIDFKVKEGNYKVERLEKDPNRSGFIALVSDEAGKNYYLLANNNLKVKKKIAVGKKVEVKEGNRTQLKKIPAGTLVCNVELYPNAGGKLARSAGSFIKLMGSEEGFSQLKMPSGEVRLVKDTCFATIGQMSNPENSAVKIGKAGRVRHKGRRPQVRGKVMNPADHPHGGGEGNQPIGLKYPKTKWGKHALGVKTRKKKKLSNKYIIKRRIRKKK
jgi:large subunit ribosomal protein L2